MLRPGVFVGIVEKKLATISAFYIFFKISSVASDLKSSTVLDTVGVRERGGRLRPKRTRRTEKKEETNGRNRKRNTNQDKRVLPS